MNWRKASIAAGVALPVVALLAYGMTRDPRAIVSPLPGRMAPDFALEVFEQGDQERDTTHTAAGDTIRLSSLRGQVVVLNFWASWCLACRDEHATLSEAAQAYADRGVRFFGVLYNDKTSNGTRWIQEMGGQAYPALADPRSRTAIDYGLYGAPETFFVGKDGRVAYKHLGPVTPSLMGRKLDSLLAAPAPLGGGS